MCVCERERDSARVKVWRGIAFLCSSKTLLQCGMFASAAVTSKRLVFKQQKIVKLLDKSCDNDLDLVTSPCQSS